MNSVPSLELLQSLITIGVVVLLWSLHARLVDRAVFKWWAWAWTSFGLYLGLGTLVLPVSEAWTLSRTVLVALASICGLLPPLLLVFGALSVQSEDLPTPQWRRTGFALAIALALLTVVASRGWSDPVTSYYVRLTPRTFALAAALLFCAWVFLSQWRRTDSRASLITGAVCLLYGTTQGLYSAALVGHIGGAASLFGSVVDPIVVWRPRLFWIDLANVYGTCIGLLLLFVEDYQQSQQALQESVNRRQEVAGENLALQAEIDVRRRAELALQRSEEKFAAAFRSNPCAMAITRFDDGQIVDVNEVLVRQSGYERAELIGRHANELGFWVNAAERAAVFAEIEAHGRVSSTEVHWRTRAGQVVTVLYSADTLEIDNRRCVLSVAEDITARKQAEATHRAVLRALPDWIFVLSADGVFLDFHARDPERLASSPESFLGKHVKDVLPPEVADSLLACFDQAMRSDETATFEYSMPSLGEIRFFEARIVRCDADKVLSIVRDITTRRRAELQARELRDELAHVGRVTTLAALTGSLAHEINQPLAAIMTNAQAARRLIAAPVPDLAELRAALTDIISDSQRAAEVVRRLRTLLKKDASEFAPVDLNESVNEVIKVLQSDLESRRITLDVELAAALPLVLGDRIQLQQVALNLLMNAFEALERDNQAVKHVRLRTAVAEAGVLVSVEDVGVGLTDEQLPRLFEPFYTTKPDGMGLGLAICQTIMNAHDGSVGVERREDKRTMFWFSLPPLAHEHGDSAMAVDTLEGIPETT
jgi:PAS domain S-box-containing protein